MIGFVVLGFAIQGARRGLTSEVKHRTAFLLAKFPRFVLGFLAISLLLSLHAFSRDQVAVLSNLSRWAFLLTFSGDQVLDLPAYHRLAQLALDGGASGLVPLGCTGEASALEEVERDVLLL